MKVTKPGKNLNTEFLAVVRCNLRGKNNGVNLGETCINTKR